LSESLDFEVEALQHLDSVYRVALWFCGNPVEAQDLTQDTYERALRARASFTRTNMRGWLLTILRNHFLNQRRRRSVAGEVELAPDLPAPGLGILDLPPALVRSDIAEALDKLAPELRLPLLMADVEELTTAEMAAALGWPLGTVKSRLWRARQELAGLLQDYRREGA
jgi:RNA polymerase sigma-70 factor (ECF subfamily)